MTRQMVNLFRIVENRICLDMTHQLGDETFLLFVPLLSIQLFDKVQSICHTFFPMSNYLLYFLLKFQVFILLFCTNSNYLLYFFSSSKYSSYFFNLSPTFTLMSHLGFHSKQFRVVTNQIDLNKVEEIAEIGVRMQLNSSVILDTAQLLEPPMACDGGQIWINEKGKINN